MNLLGYAYPWDFEPGGGAVDLVDSLGLGSVAIAAAYHSVRAATPRHRHRRFVDAPHSAVYFGPRPEKWQGRRLTPTPAPWVAPESFPNACVAARRRGARALAWVVLTHNSRLGAAYPDVTVRNAFGDSYPHALCPAQPEVVDYCRSLVTEAVLAGPADGVVLEATAALGAEHGAAHDKVRLGVSRAHQLSVCFCPRCTSRYDAAGLESTRLGQLLRDAVRADTDRGLAGVLGQGPADVVLQVRQEAARALVDAVVDVVRQVDATAEVVVHTSTRVPDYTASGTSPAAAAAADTTAYWLRNSADGAAGIVAAAARVRSARALIVEYTDTALVEPAAANQLFRDAAECGADSLHLYHLGLMPERTVDNLIGAVDAARAAGLLADAGARP